MLLPTQSAIIHCEHQVLMRQVQNLDTALDRLVCHAEGLTDLGNACEVYRWTNRIRLSFPEHVRHEERSLLDMKADEGGDWRAFAGRIVRQHAILQKELNQFWEVLDGLSHRTADLEGSISEIRTLGHRFVRHLIRHMSAEEHVLATITRHAA